MRNFLKKLFLRLAYRFNCHDECDISVPCHCGFCGKPNRKGHSCKTTKALDKTINSTIQYKKTNVVSKPVMLTFKTRDGKYITVKARKTYDTNNSTEANS